ncbi:MAG: cell division protein ZapE [Gammaproteobacteria bacterium]|nr:cell division protein ZapE [Gammaproteobacteria bacterium]
MSLIDAYNERAAKQNLDRDPLQADAVIELNRVHQKLCLKQPGRPGALDHIKRLCGLKPIAANGLYIWGSVGRGKTMLMDLFYETLPIKNKTRLHFYHFMQAIHDELSLLKGHKNPLSLVARNFAKQASVLCLDEFHVSDITDAMLLHGLLNELVSANVSLVFTSNQPPDELYKNGLQRERFLPAIELIHKHCQITELRGANDHRLRLLEKAESWYLTIDESSQLILDQRFDQLAPGNRENNKQLHINYRNISTIACADDVAWFDFNALCDGPRAAPDYMEIARQFHTVIISGIPELGDANDDKAKRFITLIDEFYDCHVKIIVSAEANPDQIYNGRQLSEEFQRTISRLQEMRSHSYISLPHTP